MVLGHRDLSLALGQWLAVFERDGSCDLGFATGNLIRNPVQQKTPILGGHRTPRGQRIFRSAQSALQLAVVNRGDPGKRLGSRRIDNLELVFGLYPLTAQVRTVRTLCPSLQIFPCSPTTPVTDHYQTRAEANLSCTA